MASIGIDLLIGVIEKVVAVVAAPAVEEVSVPFFVDLARVRSCGPVRDTTGANDRDSLWNSVSSATERFAKVPRAVKWCKGWSLAIDVDWNDREVVARGEDCLLYTSPSPRDQRGSRMPSSA